MADGGIGRQPGRGALALALAVGLIVLSTGCGRAPGDRGAAADTFGTTPDPAPTAVAASGPPTTVAEPGATNPSEPPDPTTTGRLRVTQHQTACCYPTGQVSWLVVRDAAGSEVLQRRFRPMADVYPAIDQRLEPGRYHLASAQQPCQASCARVGDTLDQCETDIDVAAGSETFLTVGLTPGAGCQFVPTVAAPVSSIPDEVALVRADLDCGLDRSLAEAAATGRNVGPATGRRCLAHENRQGVPAWLMAEEPGDLAGVTEVVVYRTQADRTVDVYRVAQVVGNVLVWERSTCDTLVDDQVREFLLQGCTQPEPVRGA